MTRPARLSMLTALAMLVVVALLAWPHSVRAAGIGQDGERAVAALPSAPGDSSTVLQAAPTTQATDEDGDALTSGVNIVLTLWQIITSVALIVAGWKIFTKAGRQGWLALIPIVNVIVLLSIVDRPWWWIILYLIPIVSIILWFVVAVDLAKAFGRSTAFGLVMIGILSLIGVLILGFGADQYRGRSAA